MINEKLKKEIINQIFGLFNIPIQNPELGFRDNPLTDKFLLPQKVKFEIDNKEYNNNIWSGEAKVENSNIQFIIADLSEDIKEYTLLLQLDNFPPYAIRISADPEDSGSIYFKVDDGWIYASGLFQARILVAVETLIEMLIVWDKNSNAANLHKTLIDFLRFDGGDIEK